MRVIDDDRRALPQDETGELAIRGHIIMCSRVEEAIYEHPTCARPP